ncbi:hypothetical protein ACFFGH_09345 [Lysobacter korlensis]|uniref:Aminoglycoside phosphotransferase domain-containing protein n=1 Tax=Lysobacter korlensis TaxID=553636 RepID=A0ABV6RML7_9GAMM
MDGHSGASAIGGGRITWDALPAEVRAGIEGRIGSRVTKAVSAETGFSPGLASVVTTEGGDRVFIKAVSYAANPDSPGLHRREAEVTAALPPGLGPRLQWWFDDGKWVALALDPVHGRHPGSPWTADDVALVLDALDRMSRVAAPPILEPCGPDLAAMFTGWSAIASDPLRAHDVPAWARPHLGTLRQREGEAVRSACEGGSIVHLDIRTDNLLIGPDGRVTLLDWPHARVGQGWLDLVFFLPTVEMHGYGSAAAEMFAAHPATAVADPDAVLTIVAGWAGWLQWMSGLPAPPGIPHLRAFQQAQAAPTLRWLRRLLEG